MQSTVKSAEMFTPVDLGKLPKGEYHGNWEGYQAEFMVDGNQYRLKTVKGITNPFIEYVECIVKIEKNSVTVETTD